MNNSTSHHVWKFWAGGIFLGGIALFIPLVQQLHFESAFLAAIIGTFWAGWRSARKPSRKVLLTSLSGVYASAIPLLIRTVWVGCWSWDGAALWILLPFPSVLLGFVVGRLANKWKLPHGPWWTLGLLLFLAVGEWLIEFYTLPQVTFFNPVWGWFPGPIYDEAIQITPVLLLYRVLTLLWVILLWYLPNYAQDRWAKRIVLGSGIALMLGYSQIVNLGIITPVTQLQRTMLNQETSGQVSIYAAEDALTEQQLQDWDHKLEFHWQWLSDTLDVQLDPDEQVLSFVYRHVWQKKQMVGAKNTSYVPVWLDQPQLHIAAPDLNRVAQHEMVHVAAKSFGNRILGASWNIGLVEGLAVALTGNRSATSTIDQLAAADSNVTALANIKNSLSLTGFYSGRSTVGYTVMGSFVQWLLRNYPVDNFKQVYAGTPFERVYPISLDSLIRGWQAHLDTVPLDTMDRATAQRLFRRPSLFEKKCPHVMGSVEKLWDDYQHARAEQDTIRILDKLQSLKQLRPEHPTVLDHWMYMQLRTGQPDSVIQTIQDLILVAEVDSLAPNLRFRWADAWAMQGQLHEAERVLYHAQPQVREAYSSSFQVRTDPWYPIWLDLIYNDHISPVIFDHQDIPTPIWQTALHIAIQQDKLYVVKRLLQVIPDDTWTFELALRTAEYMGLRGQRVEMEQTMSKAWQQANRPRYVQRWEHQRQLMDYLLDSSSVKDF